LICQCKKTRGSSNTNPFNHLSHAPNTSYGDNGATHPVIVGFQERWKNIPWSRKFKDIFQVFVGSRPYQWGLTDVLVIPLVLDAVVYYVINKMTDDTQGNSNLFTGLFGALLGYAIMSPLLLISVALGYIPALILTAVAAPLTIVGVGVANYVKENESVNSDYNTLNDETADGPPSQTPGRVAQGMGPLLKNVTNPIVKAVKTEVSATPPGTAQQQPTDDQQNSDAPRGMEGFESFLKRK